MVDCPVKSKQTENRRLARSIRKQRPFYPNRAMEKEEDERQALLKTMSRTERRKERVAMFMASSSDHPGGNAAALLMSGRRNEQQQQQKQSAATANASLVEDGVLFRPGPTAVRLRTAKQMQLEVARRRHGGGGGGSGGDDYDDQELFPSGSGGEGGAGGGRTGGLPLSSTRNGVGSLTVKRRAYSSDGAVAAASARGGAGAGGGGGGRIVLEVNRTGGGGSGRGRRRAASMGGRPNMIFTPSLTPVGMDSVRASPMTLGSAGGGSVGSVQHWEGQQANAESVGGGDALRGEDRGRGAEETTLRDPRTE